MDLRALMALATFGAGLLLALDPLPRLGAARPVPAAPTLVVRETPDVYVALHAGEPLVTGRTVVWTQAFQAAWDRLASVRGLRGRLRLGPPAREEDWAGLHAGRLGEAETAHGLLEVVSGAADEDTWKAVEALTGQPRPPAGAGREATDLVVCAALRASLRYEIPFTVHEDPLPWGAASTLVRAYGLRRNASGAEAERTRAQAHLHVPAEGATGPLIERCIVVLTARDGGRLVLSARPPKATLRDTWRDVEDLLSSRPIEPFRRIDSLSVPRVRIRVRRDYPELVGARLLDAPDGRFIGFARQDVTLVADERGADLESVAILRDVGAVPRKVVYDRPFLLALLPPGSEAPVALAWFGSEAGLGRYDDLDGVAADAATVAALAGRWQLDRAASLEATAALWRQVLKAAPRTGSEVPEADHRRDLSGWFKRRSFELVVEPSGRVLVRRSPGGGADAEVARLLRQEHGLTLSTLPVDGGGASLWIVEHEGPVLRLTQRSVAEVLILERAP